MASFDKKRRVVHPCKQIDFWEFIYNRQEVWYNRYVRKMPRPWTTDPILNEMKFCEVYRENDRCSRYLINKVINNPALSNSQKVFAILVFRIFNKDGLFDKYFREVPSVELFEASVRIKELDEAKAKGLNLFNDAYNITQRTFVDSFRKREKHVQHLLNLERIARMWNVIFPMIQASKNAEEVFNVIKGLNFFGNFLAYQCVSDISYIKKFLDHNWNAFVYVGPGARPGLDSYALTTITNYEIACKNVFDSQEQMFKELYQEKGKDWFKVKYDGAYYKSPYISLNNIQSCFCEFRKYLGYKYNTGRRKYYKPEVTSGLS